MTDVIVEIADREVVITEARQGPPGPPGLSLRGELPSTDDLPEAGAPGDAYLIDGDVWLWAGDSGTWVNGGPAGAPGPTGPVGPQGAQGPKGDTGAAGAEGAAGPQGPKGDAGDTGPAGPAGTTDWNALTNKPAVIGAGSTQAAARSAIGAGTSNFSGAYADLSGKPTLGTVAALSYPGGTSTYLRADGTWATPSAGGVSDGDKGDVIVSASGATWTIDNQAVTYAKLQNVSAQYRLLGRNSASAGSVEEVTLSQLLDWVGSAANGDILMRSGGAWTRLPIGSGGQVLTVVSGAPSWAAASSGFANPMTAAGDLITGGSAGAPGRLGVGSNGQVLTVVSGAPTWASRGIVCIPIACSDETTALTTGTAKVTFRMPFAMTDVEVRASLTSAQASGSIFTVDVNEGGSSILSTKITIDNGEKTSTTAATPPVVSDTNLADDAEITIDIDQVGDGTAAGLKVYIIGTPA